MRGRCQKSFHTHTYIQRQGPEIPKCALMIIMRRCGAMAIHANLVNTHTHTHKNTSWSLMMPDNDYDIHVRVDTSCVWFRARVPSSLQALRQTAERHSEQTIRPHTYSGKSDIMLNAAASIDVMRESQKRYSYYVDLSLNHGRLCVCATTTSCLAWCVLYCVSCVRVCMCVRCAHNAFVFEVRSPAGYHFTSTTTTTTDKEDAYI